MRGSVGVLLASTGMVLAACGGGGGDSTTSPPPAVGGVPASLTIQAGDAQEATVGLAVPLRLSVRVSDALAHPVAGTRVTFTVTAGAGALASGEATTDAAGVATSGAWTLGPIEGPNAVTAQVTGLSPVVFRAQGKAPPRQVVDTTLGVEGGTIAVRTLGHPARGVELVMPARAYPSATHVTLSVAPSLSVQLPTGVTQVGPVLEISGFPERHADAVLTLRIPVAVPAGAAAAAFIRDPTTGRMELLRPIRQDTASITVATRHFSAALMMNPLVAGTVRGRAAATAPPLIQVVVMQALRPRLQQGISSGFTPGTDDWEFPNYGSYISSGGHCAGQSITAMWYYISKRSTLGSLNGRYSTIASIWPDNPRGYRFASVVQESIGWEAAVAYDRLVYAASVGSTIPQDVLTFYAIAVAILVTGEPQFVSVFNATAGHALVAYAIDATGVNVADPNHPGQASRITFTGTAFQPYASKSNANTSSPGIIFDQILTEGTTIIFPTASLNALWPQVTNGTIGDGFFPTYTLEYFDILANAWQPLADTLRTRQSSVRIRALCTACASGIQGTKAQPLYAVDVQGNVMATATTLSGANLSPAAGTTRLAVYITGMTDAQSQGEYVDFQWRTIIRSPFSVVPPNTNALRDSVVKLTARPFGDRPASSRYVWNFGDQTGLVSVLDDSAVTHVYRKTGAFSVNVELQDAGTGMRLATAGAIVTVTAPDTAPVWRITRLTLQSLTGAVPNDTLARHPNLVTYGTYFKEKAALTAISQGTKTAYVHAINNHTLLPDCFDFDFDFNRQEMVLWPAWIWLQFPAEAPEFCGPDAVIGHYPGDETFSNGQGTSIWMGFDYAAWVRTFQGVTMPDTWDFPSNRPFASVTGDTRSGTLAGRSFQSFSLSQGPELNNVYSAHEITAQVSPNALSGLLVFTYQAYGAVLNKNGGFDEKVVATWTATYTFDAVQGR